MNKNKKQMPLQNGEELKPIMIKPNMGRMIKPMAKFPDLSGDGKVTKKDILMGRGVIKKPKMEGGKFMTKQYSKTRRNMSKAGEKAFEKARTDAAIAIGSSIPIGRVASGLARASRLKRIPGFQPSLKQQQKEKMIKAFAEFTKPNMKKLPKDTPERLQIKKTGRDLQNALNKEKSKPMTEQDKRVINQLQGAIDELKKDLKTNKTKPTMIKKKAKMIKKPKLMKKPKLGKKPSMMKKPKLGKKPTMAKKPKMGHKKPKMGHKKK